MVGAGLRVRLDDLKGLPTSMIVWKTEAAAANFNI